MKNIIKKDFLRISFVISTLVILVLPIIFFDSKTTESQQENRNLAQRPNLFSNNSFNAKVFSEYDNYLQDRFGGRKSFISLNSKLNKFLHSNASNFNDLAIKGKLNWYFYIADENLADFFKKNLLTKPEKLEFSKTIKATADWCQAQNIQCIFLVCPNKHSVYPEFYPFRRPSGATRADQLSQIFEKLGVNYIFPRDYLISKKSSFDFPLYYETDTHWNKEGAYLASLLLKGKIQSLFPNVNFPDIEYETKLDYITEGSDIPALLNLKGDNTTVPVLYPKNHNDTDFYKYLKNDGRNGVHTEGTNSSLPRALIFRDSFFTALEPFISPLFSEAEYNWHYFREDDKDYVREFKPDIIIFETVERYSLYSFPLAGMK